MDTKVCKICNLEKSIDDFYPKRKRCKKCFLLYQENNPSVKNNRKKYYQKNKENILEKAKESYHNNIDESRNYLNDRYHKNKNNPIYKIPRILRIRFLHAIKQSIKDSSCIELLGCSIEECRRYLESKFKDGMTWENHGPKGWHIDHIKPCCSYNLMLAEDQKNCFHYTNLQPLWWYENLSKGGECHPET
jgi:hypothetical protein